MTGFIRKAAAVATFAAALGGSLALAPSILDHALALDAASGLDGDHPHSGLPSEMIEARIAFLRTALQITEAQAKSWEALADVLRKQAKEKDGLITADRAYRETHFTLIQRLEQRQEELTREAADTGELLAVAGPLYAAFSDGQKRMADELLDRRAWGWRDHQRAGEPEGPHHGPVRPD
jgi:hypothetical protein